MDAVLCPAPLACLPAPLPGGWRLAAAHMFRAAFHPSSIPSRPAVPRAGCLTVPQQCDIIQLHHPFCASPRGTCWQAPPEIAPWWVTPRHGSIAWRPVWHFRWPHVHPRPPSLSQVNRLRMRLCVRMLVLCPRIEPSHRESALATAPTARVCRYFRTQNPGLVPASQPALVCPRMHHPLLT